MGKAEDDMEPGSEKGHECRLKREDAKDRERWMRLLCRAAGQPLCKQGKWL